MDTYKYSVTLYDKSFDEVIVGYCNNILGLNAENKVKNEVDTYIIECIDFKLNEKICDITKKEKFDISGYISVLDNSSEPIGDYRFSLVKEISFFDIEKSSLEKRLTLFVSLNRIIIGNELMLWDYWRENEIREKNEWTHFNEIDKRAWLNIASQVPRKYNQNDVVQGGEYYLDCINITSVESFFCALGEALIGAGGYYGFDHVNIIDCLTGGFKVVRPFTIVLKNAKIALNSLTNEAWKAAEERAAMCYIDDKSYEFKMKGSFIDEILDVFVQNDVKVVLEPISVKK